MTVRAIRLTEVRPRASRRELAVPSAVRIDPGAIRPLPIGDAEAAFSFVELIDADETVGRWGPVDPDVAEEIGSAADALLDALLSGTAPLGEERFTDYPFEGIVGVKAAGAVDCARWDGAARRAGVPLFRFLRATFDEVSSPAATTYASLLGVDAEHPAAAGVARDVKCAGFAAQKWALRSGPADGARGFRQNLAIVETIRDAVGDGYPLRFDALCGWNAAYALDFARAAREFRVEWIEEPLPPEDLPGYVALAQRSPLALAAGEHAGGLCAGARLLESRAIAVFQPDAPWCGGVSVAVRLVALAASASVPVAFHGSGFIPAVSIACALAAADTTVEYHLTLEPLRQAPFVTQLVPGDGVVAAPAGIGLLPALRYPARTVREVSRRMAYPVA